MMPSRSRRSSVGSRNGSVASALRRSMYDRNGAVEVHDQTNGTEGDGIMKIPVVGYEVKEETGRFTVFKLQVTNEEMGDSWLVFRRYTDFERLAAKLKEEFPQLSFMNLPPKRWLKNNFDTTFLEDRMKGIQAFVDSILIQHKLSTNIFVRNFFCIDEPPIYPENAEESRAIFGTLEEDILQLKDDLNKRDKEIRVLKQELELYKLRNETLMKINSRRICRSCNIKLSSTTLSAASRNGRDASCIPIQASTPNAKNGQFFRNRNKSAGNEFSSMPHSPETKLNFKSPERGISIGSFGEYQTEPQVPLSSEINTPAKAVLVREQEVQTSRPETVDNHNEIENSDVVDKNINGTDEMNGNNIPSPFEILSPTSTSSPVNPSNGTHGNGIDRNSSFELLSSSCPESESPSDDNHNKIGVATTHLSCINISAD